MKFTEEQMKKFSEAKSVEEVLALAKEEGVEINEEEIRKYYNATRIPARDGEGELSDDELDNVAGGIYACNDGRLIVSCGYWCNNWRHYQCGGFAKPVYGFGGEDKVTYFCDKCKNKGYTGWTGIGYCETCDYCVIEAGQWKCNNPVNHKDNQ